MKTPVLFISHGAPDFILEKGPAIKELSQIGKNLKPPQGIVCISAHWSRKTIGISKSTKPETIYDFMGFPDALYQLQYPAPGSPNIAKKVYDALRINNIDSELTSRGFDHGVWTPLMLLFPAADIPVVSISLPINDNPIYLYQMGQALSTLRDQGIMLIASGSVVHNLWRMKSLSSPPQAWAIEFEQWLDDNITNNNIDNLLNWHEAIASSQLAHPTSEHLSPLFVALGAAGDFSVNSIRHGFRYASIGLSHYIFS